ncbi:Rassf1 [Fasciola hepatica]|uniref:Rassf1 n=1 Tax=Fasciola hepatica TaxID=6192 RepID=A0A4E0RYD0_FASHE|nr:Rassf1 [Fasciola hepatica]
MFGADNSVGVPTPVAPNFVSVSIVFAQLILKHHSLLLYSQTGTDYFSIVLDFLPLLSDDVLLSLLRTMVLHGSDLFHSHRVVIHKFISSCRSTTAQKVISTLLDRFQIEDNPQKFALYEHTIEGDQEVSVRKLFDDESPLGLLFRWTENGPGQFNHLLGVKRLVLQENETGDIEWSGFSLPELTVFLGILNQEEADYRRRIEMKFEVRRKEILRLMALCEREETEVIEDSVSTEPTAFVRELSDDEMEMTSGPSDSLSTPASPLLQSRKAINPTEPESPSSPIAPSHMVGPGAASTLPRFFCTDDRLKSTLFKPSQYKRLKKAERAQQKLLAKTERDRIKAEKKKKKSESKQAQQNPGTQTHGRKWLTGLSAAFSPSVAASSSDNRSAPSS